MTTIRYNYKDGSLVDRQFSESADDIIQSTLAMWRFARCFKLYPCPITSIEVFCEGE